MALTLSIAVFAFTACNPDAPEKPGVHFDIPQKFRGIWESTGPIKVTFTITSSDIFWGEQSFTEMYDALGASGFSQDTSIENTYTYSFMLKGKAKGGSFTVNDNTMVFNEYSENQLTNTTNFIKIGEPPEDPEEVPELYADATKLAALSYIAANNVVFNSDESASVYFSDAEYGTSNGYTTVTRRVISQYTDTASGVILYPDSAITATILKNSPNEFAAGLSKLDAYTSFSSSPDDKHHIFADIPLGGIDTDGLVVTCDGESVDKDEFIKIVIENVDMTM